MDQPFRVVHSSELTAEALRRWLADDTTSEHLSVFRRLLLKRFAVIVAIVGVLVWPVHSLPQTAFWVALTILVLAVLFTTAPARQRLSSTDSGG